MSRTHALLLLMGISPSTWGAYLEPYPTVLNPPDVVYVLDPELPVHVPGGNTSGDCSVRLSFWTQPVYARVWAVSTPNVNPAPGVYSCFGIDVSPPLDKDPRTAQRIIQKVGKEGLSLKPGYQTGSIPQNCYVTMTYGFGGMNGGGFRLSCSYLVTPELNRCYLSGPTILEHGLHPGGGIRSERSETWRVRCEQPADVRITVPSLDLPLTNASGDQVRSSLYVGAPGRSELRVRADLSSDFTLGSVVSSSHIGPGSYSGSSTVTVTWD